MMRNRQIQRAALLAAFVFIQSFATDATHAQAGGEAGYAGPKKSIFVGNFESSEVLLGAATGEGLSAMLTDALVKDGRFIVVERAAFQDIQAEQELGQSGMATPESAVPKGRLIGASATIRGAVTQFEPRASGGRIGIGGPGLFGRSTEGMLGLSGAQAIVVINLRIIDMATGQVIATSKAEGYASASGFSADVYTAGGMEIGGEAFSNTPLGKAAEQAIREAVGQIAAGMDKLPWSALVVENIGGNIYINAGAGANMKEGTILHVYRKVKELTDPATGAAIDTLIDKIGSIRIQSVREKTSVATVTEGGAPVRGDILKLQ